MSKEKAELKVHAQAFGKELEALQRRVESVTKKSGPRYRVLKHQYETMLQLTVELTNRCTKYLADIRAMDEDAGNKKSCARCKQRKDPDDFVPGTECCCECHETKLMEETGHGVVKYTPSVWLRED